MSCEYILRNWNRITAIKQSISDLEVGNPSVSLLFVGSSFHGDNAPWWRHQIETFSALLAICAGNSPVPGEFPGKRPVTRSFDVFFDLRMNKSLNKQSRGWWFEMPSHSLWCHYNAMENTSKTKKGDHPMLSWAEHISHEHIHNPTWF